MDIDLTKTQKYLNWFKTKLYLDAISSKAKTRVVKRGQVYWCDFGMNIGSEMSKEVSRPCVIVQNDSINIKPTNTIVVPITHNTSKIACLVPIAAQMTVDDQPLLDGQINISNIVCVSKARLGDLITTLTVAEMKSIDIAIASQLDLYGYYKDIEKRLNSKLEYIEKIKIDRNYAQDLLKELREKLGVNTDSDILKIIENLLDK